VGVRAESLQAPLCVFSLMLKRLRNSTVICLLMIGAARAFLVRHSTHSSSAAVRQSTRISLMSTLSSSQSKNLVIIIAGPTGVGKSDVAAKICGDSRGIIVSADSVQAYRGVQIGANKPSPAERLETPHLLVDMVDATEQYNAAEWRRDALSCVDILLQKDDGEQVNPKWNQLKKDIADAKRIKGFQNDETVRPVVVGGTMMYLQWLVHGQPDATQPTEQAIQKAQADIEEFQANNEDGWEKATAHVSSLNPIFAARVEKLCGKDWYRLRRTMEIAYTVLDTTASHDKSLAIESLFSGEREGGLDSFGYDVRCFFLCPSDRMEHTAIVDQRCEEMILRGLFQETTDLQVTNLMPEMVTKAIGYRQVLDYLQRAAAKDNDADSFDAFLNDFSTATRRYAKKQMAWFRKDKTFAFVPVSLQDTKADRAEMTANQIQTLCQLSRQDYEAALETTPADTTGKVPLSYETRLANEAQGKKMKFYQFQRYKLKKGSTEYDSTLQHADKCTARIKEYLKQQVTPLEKRPRLL
jgi:tRNA dimethylallyltransferase